MVKTAWVTDSTAFLDEDLKMHPDLYINPLTIILDGEEYQDGVDLTAEELFAKLKMAKTQPKTSQPSIGSFQTLYEQLEKEYDQVITILLSGKLSGTVSSSQQAANLVKISVITIDSKILTYPLTALIKKGMEWLSQGKSLEYIVKKIESIRDTNEAYVLVGSLEQLHRGGRMSGLQFFLGSMLNIKPIVSIEDGALTIKEKVRSEKKAKDKIVEYLRISKEQYKMSEVYILYGLHNEQAENWKNVLMDQFPELQIFCCPLGAVIGVHAGENTLGISWFQKLE